MKPILEINNISKEYNIYHKHTPYLSFRDSLASIFSTKKGKSSVEIFWALKDVSFDVYPGESIGIIGKNGAGKSTLLKILSKITPPTKGKIISRGRVASLLEVGTGFHPELTGRENIFLNGSILGMKRKEILKKFDEIVDFSGVEKFLDTPLKHYSSGMQLRLAFAVAAFLEPEILLIDEVLAVGDAEFQKKCIGKMEDVSLSGRTILFVSHNLLAVKQLCRKAFLLESGAISSSGNPSEVVDVYLKKSIKAQHNFVFGDFEVAPGSEDVRIKKIFLENIDASEKNVFFTNNRIRINIVFWVLKNDVNLDLTYNLLNEENIIIFNQYAILKKELSSTSICSGLYECQWTIPANLLNSGGYKIELWFGINQFYLSYKFDREITFEISASYDENQTFEKKVGVINPLIPKETLFLNSL